MPNANKPEEKPPDIIWPDEETRKYGPNRPQAGSIRNVKPALNLIYIKGLGLESLVVNLLTVVLLIVALHLAIGKYSHNPMFNMAVPLSLAFVGIVLMWKRLYVTLDARKGKRFLDTLTKWNIVYGPGFHFVSWTHFPVADGSVDFQLHELIEASMEKQTAIKFPTKDGYEMFIDMLTMFRIVEQEKDLARSLNYSITESKRKILAHIASWLSELGGRNSYLTLLYYKAPVFAKLALLFDGEENRSILEIDMGVDIANPIGLAMDLTPESRKTFQVKAKVQVIAAGAKSLKEELPGASPDQCLIVAAAAEGSAEHVVQTFNTPNLPDGLHTLVLGDSNVAVGGKARRN